MLDGESTCTPWAELEPQTQIPDPAPASVPRRGEPSLVVGRAGGPVPDRGNRARRATGRSWKGRLLQQWPTEDGYLMLTIARNLAIGNGMTTSDGSIPSNGVQPMATFLWGSGRSGRSTATSATASPSCLALELLVSVLTAWALFRLGCAAFHRRSQAKEWAALAALAWWASPVAVPHTMNCLETGLYLWLGLEAWRAWLQTPEDAPFKRWVWLGVLCGLVFWARIDAVLLVGAMTLAHLVLGPRGARLGQALTFSGVSALIAVPWVIHNIVQFGSPMPISGQSESMGAAFGRERTASPLHSVRGGRGGGPRAGAFGAGSGGRRSRTGRGGGLRAHGCSAVTKCATARTQTAVGGRWLHAPPLCVLRVLLRGRPLPGPLPGTRGSPPSRC